MDQKAFLAHVPADLRERMVERSDGPGLRHLGLHLGLILGIGAGIAGGVPGWWALLPVQGVLVISLFMLEHEATHRTPFRTVWLNDWVGRLCGVLLVLPFEWFRAFHMAHHRWTNLPGKDPELAGPKPATRGAWVWHVSGLPYWMAEVRLMVDLVRGRVTDGFVAEGAKARVVAEARGMAVVYLAAGLSLVWTDLVLWVWLVPVLLGQPVLRLYLLAEHGDCPEVANMFENTRTTFTTRVVRCLAWNMPYHVEHHVWPTVPFHRLPEVHGLMREELKVTSDGYAAFMREYLARRPRWTGSGTT